MTATTKYKEYPFECIVCHKQFIATERIETKGLLKGMKIVSSVTCSKKCEGILQRDLNSGYMRPKRRK